MTVQHTDAKLQEIIATQEEIFVRRQPESARLAAAAAGKDWAGLAAKGWAPRTCGANFRNSP